jgi:hypothetical protein
MVHGEHRAGKSRSFQKVSRFCIPMSGPYRVREPWRLAQDLRRKREDPRNNKITLEG